MCCVWNLFATYILFSSVVSSLCVGKKDAINAITRHLHGTISHRHKVEMFALSMYSLLELLYDMWKRTFCLPYIVHYAVHIYIYMDFPVYLFYVLPSFVKSGILMPLSMFFLGFPTLYSWRTRHPIPSIAFVQFHGVSFLTLLGNFSIL
jgi:hypothetical protein